MLLMKKKMACFKYYEYSFLYSFSGIFSGLNLAHAWSYRLFEAWLVSGWFKVDLLGGVKVFFPALSQHNLNRYFIAQI